MKHEVFTSLKSAAQYLKEHPQFFFTLLLLVVIPFGFHISGQKFLSVSESNYSRLEYNRIGLLHDSFLSVIKATKAEETLLQDEIERLGALNPDFVVFRVVEKSGDQFVPIAALNEEIIGSPEGDGRVYNYAFTNPNDSLVDSVVIDGVRYIRGVRYASYDDRELVILTMTSREQIDALFNARVIEAYLWLGVILLVILWLVIRHVRLIDYSYLYKEAKKANETKDLFTNMIAHELRAPLTAMRGYASLIQENDTVEHSVREEATRIEQSAGRLLLLVNDLLDVARIQSGKLSVIKETVNISSVIETVGEELEVKAREKHITLAYSHIPKDVRILGDEKRLHQVITNLLSNAIKYTHEGTIEIGLEERHDRVELRVKDTGMGISAEDQKKLFAPFFRVQSDDVSSITGTGLGMWITKQLVELMGGSIGIESIKGVGTHVVITLPKH